MIGSAVVGGVEVAFSSLGEPWRENSAQAAPSQVGTPAFGKIHVVRTSQATRNKIGISQSGIVFRSFKPRPPE